MSQNPKKKENFFLNISINVIIPAVIMSKFSSKEHLGEVWGLIIALAFPLTYGLWDLVKLRKFNFFSILGLISVLLTGGIGLLKLDKQWMVVKETAIPLLMGVVVIVSQKTKFPLVRTFLNQIIDLDKVHQQIEDPSAHQTFEKKLSRFGFLLGASFFLSALLNFFLAQIILQGNPGSVEFNESLGKMTALSFPVITVPMMIVTAIILIRLLKAIKDMTGLELENIIRQ